MMEDDLFMVVAVIAALVGAMLLLSLLSVSGVALLRRLGLVNEALSSDVFAPPQVVPQRDYNPVAARARRLARESLQERYDRLARSHGQWLQGQEACHLLAQGGHNIQALQGRLQQLSDDIAAALPNLTQEADPSTAIAQRAESLYEDISQALAALPNPRSRSRFLLLLLIVLLLLIIAFTLIWPMAL